MNTNNAIRAHSLLIDGLRHALNQAEQGMTNAKAEEVLGEVGGVIAHYSQTCGLDADEIHIHSVCKMQVLMEGDED